MAKTRSAGNDKVVVGANCVTGKTEMIRLRNGMVESIIETESTDNRILIGPGLIDLQINGINGIDFNTPELTEEDVLNATHYLISQGVTTFFPTVITNSDENIVKIVNTIKQACLSYPLVNECIGGIHLEGPFISPADGAKGAHDRKHIKAPDWDLFCRFQEASGNKIKIVTLAPEWEGSKSFIQQCRVNRVIVSIGHSIANGDQIREAVKAGATLSTHLGNGVPLLLPRHPNVIWDQLAAEELYACIIADGIHIPDPLIKVVMKVKLKATLLVSDATCFAGMAPGDYERHVGGRVTLNEEKRVSLKETPGMLAGAGMSLLENLEIMISHGIATITEAWQMASVNVVEMLSKHNFTFGQRKLDLVLFELTGNKIYVTTVIKNGKVVWVR